MSASISLDELNTATMTPEELAAIKDGEEDLSPDELASLKSIAGDDDDDDDDDDAADGALDANGSPAKTDEKPADENPAVEVTDADDKAEPVAPRYEAKLPSDYDEQINGLKERDAELRQKFKNGEIDIDERDDGLAALAEQREQLLVARAKAEISQEMNAQTLQQQWQNTISRALNEFAKPDQGGIDYRKDPSKMDDLDGFVKMLANKPEHENKSMDWFLQEAHKRVQALYGISPKPATDDPVRSARESRKPDLNKAPKTLAQVPGGDGPGDVGTEFAEIDSLDGDDLEAAIARMTPAQRQRYANAR